MCLTGDELLRRSRLYRELVAELAEIEKHKWYESERRGHDVGWFAAYMDWAKKYRREFRKQHIAEMERSGT
jgi:hypothetical protein